MQAAAIAAALGVDPRSYLRADSFERAVLDAVLRRVDDLVDIREHNLAVRIANNLGRVLS